MSYSFSVRGATRADVAAKIAEKLEEVVTSQPVHSVDRAQAQAAAEAFVGVVPEVDGMDIYVSVSGSVGWQGTLNEGHVVTSAGFGVSASSVARE